MEIALYAPLSCHLRHFIDIDIAMNKYRHRYNKIKYVDVIQMFMCISI